MSPVYVRQAGPLVWLHPNIFPAGWPDASPSTRYVGTSETQAAFTEPDWTAAVSRADVLSVGVDACRDQTTGEADPPDGRGTEGFLTRLVAMAAGYGKTIAMEAAGPVGTAGGDDYGTGHTYPATGAGSADRDNETSLANLYGAGGTCTYLGMDHPIHRVMQLITRNIASVSSAAAAVVTTSGSHGFVTGDIVYLNGTTCTPTVDGLRMVTVTGATTFTVPVTTTVAQGSAVGTVGAAERTAIAQVIEYMQTIHAEHPEIQIGYIDQMGWWETVASGDTFGGYFGRLMDAVDAADEYLAYYNLDVPYEHTMGLVEPKQEETNILDLLGQMQDIIAARVPVGLIINSAFGGGTPYDGVADPTYHPNSGHWDGSAYVAPFVTGSNSYFQRDTLRWAEVLRRYIAAGRMSLPTHLVIESFYYYPRALAPETTSYTFADTFLKAKAVFNAEAR